MALINDTHSREIQQVYLNFYQSLVHLNPKNLEGKWHDDENNEETQDEESQDTEKSSQSHPEHDNYSQSQQLPNNSSPSNNLTPSSSENNSNSAQISFHKDQGETTSNQPDSLLFQVTKNEKFVDEIELNKDGIKSKKSTSSSERLLAQIEILQSLPEGTIIPTAPSIQVQSVEKQGDKTLSTEILLSTDQQGKITKNTLTPSPQKTGTQVVHEQLSSLSDSSVVQYLENLIETRVNERLNSLSPDLQSQREQDPHNVKWWQQLLQKGGELLSNFAKEHQHQQVNQQQRLSIINNNLSADESKALSNLGKYSIDEKRQQTLQNPALITRANRLAAQLVQIAQQQQKPIRKTGRSYTLAVNPNGDVEISALERGVIYHQTHQGDTPIATSLMTETDLTFFERQFQSYMQQSSQSSVQTPTSTQTTTPTRSRRR